VIAAPTRIPLVETCSYTPATSPILELNEAAKTESWARKLPDGRYRVRQVGQHCWLGEGRGLEQNRNNRRYPATKTWGRHTVAESAFMQRVRARRVIGQVEHPDNGRNDLGLAALLIAEVSAPCPRTGKVFVEWETLSTPGGQILACLIKDRVGFGFSSRGNGSVLRVDGVDEVQEDFEPVTFDAVADESTPGAELAATTIREGFARAMAAAGGDLNEAIRQDRQVAAKALAAIMECLGDGGAPAACCAQTLGEVSVRHEPTGDNGKLLAESGGIRARGFFNGLGQVDVILEHRQGDGSYRSELKEMGVDTMHGAQQKAMHFVAQAMQALASDAAVAAPAAGNNPHEAMIMPSGGEWVLGTRDGAGHYRAFENGPGRYQVWYCGHNIAPVLVASGLRTMKDSRAAAENHLYTVVGEHSMQEQVQVAGTMPFSGTSVSLRFDDSAQRKKAKKTIEKAGFHCEEKGENEIVIQAENPEAGAVLGQLRRVLDGVGIEMSENVAEADYMSRASMTDEPGYEDDEDEDMMDEPGYEDEDMMDEEPGYDMGYMDMMVDDDEQPMDDYMEEPGDYDDDDDDEGPDMMQGFAEPDYMEDNDCMCGEPDCPDCMKMEANEGPTFVGDPEVGLDPSEDEDDAGDPYETDYEGRDPEDLDLDLDVNERRRRRRQRMSEAGQPGYGQPGQQRGNPVAGASSSAKAGGEFGGERRKNSDIERTGGSVEAEKRGSSSDSGDAQRPAREAGSNLPKKGKGSSETQKAAKMAESIPRALADLRRAWARGDGRAAVKISNFLEHVGAATRRGLAAHVSDSARVRYLQEEVARLEVENVHLRALNEAMTEVQRIEVMEMERKLILRDHPELAEAEETLARCDTLDEIHAEKDRLLRLTRSAPRNEGQGTPRPSSARVAPEQHKDRPSTAPGFNLIRESAGDGGVSSLSVEGAPTKPLTESTVGSLSGSVTPSDSGDVASRMAASKRRRRQRG